MRAASIELVLQLTSERAHVWLGKELGGYRRGGYKAQMRIKLFKKGIEKLLEKATQKRKCII